MNNPEKFLKMMSSLIEAGVLTSQDLAKAVLTSMKFNREKIANKLDLVTREELDFSKQVRERLFKDFDVFQDVAAIEINAQCTEFLFVIAACRDPDFIFPNDGRRPTLIRDGSFPPHI